MRFLILLEKFFLECETEISSEKSKEISQKETGIPSAQPSAPEPFVPELDTSDQSSSGTSYPDVPSPDSFAPETGCIPDESSTEADSIPEASSPDADSIPDSTAPEADRIADSPVPDKD